MMGVSFLRNGNLSSWLINKQCLPTYWASLVTQMVKNLSAMQETRVQSLGCEDPQEKGVATHYLFAYYLLSTFDVTDIVLGAGDAGEGEKKSKSK